MWFCSGRLLYAGSMGDVAAPLELTLLGTGMPQPDADRRGPAQVIAVGAELVLIDCGAGTLHRLLEAGYSGRDIRRIAVTHLHSDHVTGLPDLLWAGWCEGWWDPPPPIAGPPGTAELLHHLLEAFAVDIRLRTAEGALKRANLELPVEQIAEGWSVESDRWRLRSFEVDHRPVEHAFGFRLEAEAGTVVVSGDTRRCDNVARNARGADILVHEAIWEEGMRRLIAAAPTPEGRARFERILAYHTPAREAGEIAALADAAHLVLTHLVLAGAMPDDLASAAAETFDGRITVGEDLASFPIG